MANTRTSESQRGVEICLNDYRLDTDFVSNGLHGMICSREFLGFVTPTRRCCSIYQLSKKNIHWYIDSIRYLHRETVLGT